MVRTRSNTPESGDHVRNEVANRSRNRRAQQRALSAAQRSSRPPRNDLRPDLQLVERPLDQLKRERRRLHKADEAQVERIASAIRQLGFCGPVLIAGDDAVIDGHARLEAAKRCGLTQIPCIVVDHLSPDEQRVLAISLNRLPQTAVWDFDALKLELEELLIGDAPLEASGFTIPEIDALLLDDTADAEAGPPEPEPSQVAVTQPGDLWLLGHHRLLCGDARDAASYDRLFRLEDGGARVVLTDVPYNVKVQGHVSSGGHREFAMASGEMSSEQFAGFMLDWMSACYARLRDGGLLMTFIDWRGLSTVQSAGERLGLSLINLIVWAKTNGGQGALWRSQHELLPVLKKGAASHVNNVELGRHGRYRSNVWTYPGASSLGSDSRSGLKLHPTVKPRAMLEDALLDISERGDLVLEPFLGSGSTLVACEATGRVCRAIEIDPLYCDVAVRRWQELTGDTARRDDGTRFEQARVTAPASDAKPRFRMPARRG